MNSQRDAINWPLILTTAIGPLIWGSTYMVTTEFLPPERPYWAALFRCLPAGLILIATTGFKLPLRENWRKLLALSALNIGVFQALLFIAAYRLPGGLAAVMGAVQPLMVMVLILVVDKIPPSKSAWLAAFIGVLGMAVLLLGPSAKWDTIGVAAALGGAACMGLGTFLTNRWKLPMPVLALTGWQLLLGGLMLLPLALFVDPSLPSLTPRNVLGYAYLCLFGSVLAYSLWFRAAARISPAAVSSLALLSPLAAVILGWVFLGQSLTARTGIGFALVLLSIIGVQLTSSSKRAS